MKKFACSYYIGWLCVSINSSILSYFLIAWVCQWWLRTWHPKSFTKYNYILAAALDGGTQVPLCKCLVLHMDYSRQLQVMVFILSFATFSASGDSHLFPAWWGANKGGKGLPMKSAIVHSVLYRQLWSLSCDWFMNLDSPIILALTWIFHWDILGNVVEWCKNDVMEVLGENQTDTCLLLPSTTMEASLRQQKQNKTKNMGLHRFLS